MANQSTFEKQLDGGGYLIAEIIPDDRPKIGPGIRIAVYPTEDDSVTHSMGMVPTAKQLKPLMIEMLQWLYHNVDQESCEV